MNIKFNDKDYWTKLYKNNGQIPKTPSPFARHLIDNGFVQHSQTLIELGCGNGRDSVFFAKNQINVIAIDQCEDVTSLFNKIERINSYSSDFTRLPFLSEDQKINIVYSRFTLHSIDEEGEDRTLNWAYENLAHDGLFCIEVRTTKDPLCGVGVNRGDNIWYHNNHHRRFVEAEKFQSKLELMGFDILFFQEKNGFAKYKNEDPVVLRSIVRK